MNKQNVLTSKNQMFTLASLQLQASKLTAKDQRQIKGGSGDSIIIEEDMVI